MCSKIKIHCFYHHYWAWDLVMNTSLFYTFQLNRLSYQPKTVEMSGSTLHAPLAPKQSALFTQPRLSMYRRYTELLSYLLSQPVSKTRYTVTSVCVCVVTCHQPLILP